MAAVGFDDLAVIAVSDGLLGKDGEKKKKSGQMQLLYNGLKRKNQIWCDSHQQEEA